MVSSETVHKTNKKSKGLSLQVLHGSSLRDMITHVDVPMISIVY